MDMCYKNLYHIQACLQQNMLDIGMEVLGVHGIRFKFWAQFNFIMEDM